MFTIPAAVSRADAEAAARKVLQDPRCLMDEWSLAFLAKYGTVEALADHGRSVLVGLGLTLKHDICRIECRHASIRRIIRAMGSTRAAAAEMVSGDFTLLRQRLLEQLLSPAPPAATGFRGRSAAAKAKARVRRVGRWQGSRTGGGGRQRAAVRRILLGRPMRT
eukprot:9135111-Lingulodinium_polyedra.AAC.1